jgi:integrase
MFAWGMEHGLCASNPFAGISLASAPMRERFLTREEAGRLLDAIANLESIGAVSNTFADALRLLLLTGARKTEVLGLRWSEVDIMRGILVLPPDRTKAGGKTGVRRILLSPPAFEILKARREELASNGPKFAAGSDPAAQHEFVFPAARGEGHAVGLRRVFQKVCADANLPRLRVHDLRHSFASFAVANGASLFLVGKLLGHASARTTERYAHLSGDPLQDAVTSIGRDIMRTDR